MTTSNIPLMNGQRLETETRTSDGVLVHQPLYRPIAGVAAANALVASLKSGGSGSASLNVNGAVTTVYFWHAAEAAKLTTIGAFSMVLADGAAVAAGFGGLAALTVGLSIDLVNSDGTTVAADLTGGLAVKSHADLIALGAGVSFLDTSTGDDLVAVRWVFPSPFELTAGQRFRVGVRDDLTGLSAARAFVTGSVRTA